MFIQTKSREIGSEMPSSVSYMAGYRNQSKEKRITRLGYVCVCVCVWLWSVWDSWTGEVAGGAGTSTRYYQQSNGRVRERETVEIGRKLFCFCVSCEMCLMSCSEYQQSCKKSLQNVARKKRKRTKEAAELGKEKWEMGKKRGKIFSKAP